MSIQSTTELVQALSVDDLDDMFKELEAKLAHLKIPKSKQVLYILYHLPGPMYYEILKGTFHPFVWTLPQFRERMTTSTDNRFCKGILSIPYDKPTLYPFEEETNDWNILFEQFTIHFAVHDVPSVEEMEAIKNYLPEKAFKDLSQLLSPIKFEDLTFPMLKRCVLEVTKSTSLHGHITVSGNGFKQRQLFFRRNQHCNESLSDYYEALCKLAVRCEFGPNINEQLRDRLIFGLYNPALRKLCQNWHVPPPTGADALFSIKSLKETLQKDSDLRAAASLKKMKEDQNKCFRCGIYGHYPNNCRFLKARCRHCFKRGHIKTVCRKLMKESGADIDDGVIDAGASSENNQPSSSNVELE